VNGIIGFQNLAPGLYQVATSDEIKEIPAAATLREDDHFWLESKNKKVGDEWVSTAVMCHTGTAGLLIQANAIGAHAHSTVVELDRNRVRVIARGYHLRRDGLLEVIEKSKEYDLAAELFKGALKEVKSTTPSGDQSTALARTATEETALALANTLPPRVKAKVMERRMEVQTHREALCRTKAENMVLRYFIAQAGGVLKLKPGFGEKTVELTQHVLTRKLETAEVQSAAEDLFGKPRSTEQSEAVQGEVVEPEAEETGVLAEEGADASEAEAAAEDGGPDSPEPEPEADNPPTIEAARAECDRLWTAARAEQKLGHIESMPPKAPKDASVEDLLEWCERCRAFIGKEAPAKGGAE